ncbi:MAG: TolC family protein, partial [Candidatus Sericytochromatia bacterium]
MRRLTVMMAIWAALAAPAVAQAPDPAPLRLETVLQETLRRHPLLRSAAAELEAAEGEAMAALGTFDLTARANGQIEEPSYYATRRLDAWLEQYTPFWGATLYGGYRLGRGDFAPYDAKLATNDLGEWRGGVRLPLLQGGIIDRRRAEVEKQQLAVRLAALRLRLAQLEQLRAAANRYWEWVAAGRRYRITQVLL